MTVVLTPSGSAMSEAVEALRTAGLRVTGPRRSVLGWLSGHPHSTAEQVRAGVRAAGVSISYQAVYDVLRAGVAAGLVRRLEPDGHPSRYERRADDHHHLVCRRCDRIVDVDGVRGDGPCLDTVGGGYAVEAVEVMFWGLCAPCTHGRGGPAGIIDR